MKIQIVNSPFDFDEVGEKTANRWFKQGRGTFSEDGKTLTLHSRATWNAISSRQEPDPVSGKFEWYVGESGQSYMQQIEGIGGMRGYQASHGA